MRVLIINSTVSDQFAYSPGERRTLPDAEANRLINGGNAIRLIESDSFHEHIETAAEAADYTPMASGTAPVPTPSGGYWWDDDDRLHVVHPSGAHVILDPLHPVFL